MRIAFASGKGGAGKTTVAASLAVVWPRPCLIVDADVEAPNLYLFLQPDLDAAQAVSHAVPDLANLACDFMAFSGHKMYGPMGIGVLAGRQRALERLHPLRLGGDMVEWVRYDSAAWAELHLVAAYFSLALLVALVPAALALTRPVTQELRR